MSEIPHLKKKIGGSWLVWMQNSNSYLQLEEPAWFVFNKTTHRYKSATIAKDFALRYGVSTGESEVFVKEICSQTEKLNQIDIAQNKSALANYKIDDQIFCPFSVHYYQLGDKRIAFSCETPNFENYIHPLICHLESDKSNNAMALFELFTYEEQIVFRFNGEVKGIWSGDETHLVKGLIFMFLINVIYDKNDTDWLMTVHASAITNGKKTILFTAPPGHGKTTIAALLQSRGYRLISDDFVPIDRNSFKAYPFPIAMSIKQGAMEVLSTLFAGLNQKEINYITPEKSVRYLVPDPDLDVFQALFPVREFIFVNYNSSVDFLWEKLDKVKAIKLLLDQAWVVPSQGNAAILFEWITKLSFFQLTYSNNEKALNKITKLFDHA